MIEDAAPLAGQVAVVTGSSSGIGLEVAKSLRADGASVVLVARDRDRLEAAALDVRDVDTAATEAQVSAIPADVTDLRDVERLCGRVLDEFSRADVLINNAGRTLVADSLTLSLEDWNDIVSVNLTAAFLCCQAFGRVMIRQAAGVIVNIGSIFGVVGSARRAAYCSTKHALAGLTKVLASEWGPHGVRVCIVNAGYVRTPMVQRMLDSGVLSEPALATRIPAARLAEAAEVAAAVAYLVSDRAAYANGTALNLDGGWLANSGW